MTDTPAEQLADKISDVTCTVGDPTVVFEALLMNIVAQMAACCPMFTRLDARFAMLGSRCDLRAQKKGVVPCSYRSDEGQNPQWKMTTTK